MTAATLLAGFALAATFFAVWCWPSAQPAGVPPRGRFARGGRRLLSLGLIAAALLAALLAAGLQQYRPWRPGDLIAELAVREIGPQRFEVTVSLPGETPRALELSGDQWQFDVRLLRWTLPAALLGAPRLYQPDRISGRYADIEAERSRPRSAHALSAEGDWDAWQWKRRMASALPILAADYGSSVYLPLIDGARFHVLVGDMGGIEVRPADAESARRLGELDW